MGCKEHAFAVTPEEQGQRLDLYLKAKLSDLTRSQIKKLIQAGHIVVNQSATKAGYLVKAGDRIRVSVPLESHTDVAPEDIPLNIVYEDEDILVVDKPAGLAVHPGAGIRSGTLVNALLYHFKSLPTLSDQTRAGIVHRLDKLTSGLLVVAKSELALRNLAQQFKSRQVAKEYIALVYGEVEKMSDTIDLAIGRDPQDRKKISPRARRARAATTSYEVLERLAGFTLLRLKLHTGRTHQIRVHLSAIGHPVVGDQVYGGKRYRGIQDQRKRQAIAQLGRYFLHAHKLSLAHPRSGRILEFASPLPPELESLLSLLR